MLYRVPHLQIYLEGLALSIAVASDILREREKLLIWVLETDWKTKQFCFTVAQHPQTAQIPAV